MGVPSLAGVADGTTASVAIDVRPDASVLMKGPRPLVVTGTVAVPLSAVAFSHARHTSC